MQVLEALCHSTVAVKAAKSVPRPNLHLKQQQMFFCFFFFICSSRVDRYFPTSQLLQIGHIQIYHDLDVLIHNDINVDHPIV